MILTKNDFSIKWKRESPIQGQEMVVSTKLASKWLSILSPFTMKTPYFLRLREDMKTSNKNKKMISAKKKNLILRNGIKLDFCIDGCED